MIYVIIINFIFSIYPILYFESILVNQYYSIKRFVKVIFQKETYKSLKIIKIKRTRRNSFLLVVSLLLSFFIPFFLSFLTLIVAYYFLYPLEIINLKKYEKRARRKIISFNGKIIGITGSYGKTTLKNYLVAYLSNYYKVLAPQGNINTSIGIMKFINSTNINGLDILILEMGIDEINGFDSFKKFIKLDYAFITSIGETHLSTFKTIDNILIGKLKIRFLLKREGFLLINKDDDHLKNINNISHISYNSLPVLSKEFTNSGYKINFNNHHIQLNIYNEYFLHYLGALFALSQLLNLNEESFVEGIKKIKQIHRRQEVIKIENGYLINDSYNVNIYSFISSLNLLDKFEGISYIITSGIIEQGKKNIEINDLLYKLLENRNMIFVGDNSHSLIKNRQYKNMHVVSSINDAYSLLNEIEYNNLLVFPVGEKIHLI